VEIRLFSKFLYRNISLITQYLDLIMKSYDNKVLTSYYRTERKASNSQKKKNNRSNSVQTSIDPDKTQNSKFLDKNSVIALKRAYQRRASLETHKPKSSRKKRTLKVNAGSMRWDDGSLYNDSSYLIHPTSLNKPQNGQVIEAAEFCIPRSENPNHTLPGISRPNTVMGARDIKGLDEVEKSNYYYKMQYLKTNGNKTTERKIKTSHFTHRRKKSCKPKGKFLYFKSFLDLNSIKTDKQKRRMKKIFNEYSITPELKEALRKRKRLNSTADQTPSNLLHTNS